MNTTATKASLPSELWIEVFHYISSFEQLIQCSLVNSKWKQFTETVMFRRDITIIDPMDASIFYAFLKSNPDMNQLVKHLTIAPQHPSLRWFAGLIPLVLTHKMETFNGSVSGYLFFKILLCQTFGHEGTARFISLKTIPSAWNYNKVYDKLLHRLRYILKEITLNFRSTPSDTNMKWPTLYRLKKMTQLQALTFNSYVHNVKRTEAILKNCGRLERLTICLANGDLFSGEANINQ